MDMHNEPQFGKDEQEYSVKGDLQLFAAELSKIRRLFSQQLEQDRRREELNLLVISQQRDLKETNIALENLIQFLDLYKVPDYEPTFEALAQRTKNLDDTNRQMIKIVSRIDLSSELSGLVKNIESLNNKVNTVKETLEEQQKLLQTNFDWKVLAAQVAVISIVTTTMLVLALRWFPPNPLLDKELQVIYNKVEQMRKAKK
jgi:valyl-tRNA synthetase